MKASSVNRKINFLIKILLDVLYRIKYHGRMTVERIDNPVLDKISHYIENINFSLCLTLVALIEHFVAFPS